MAQQRIVIIGAGIGGLSAAVLLASRGEDVLVLERAAAPGGKMRRLNAGGHLIDGGPTVLTMRWVFEQIFADAGANLSDHLVLEPLAILARHAWSQSEQLDLHADLQASADAVGVFSGAEEARRFLNFAAESRRIYETLEGPFIRSQRPGPVRLATANGLAGLRDMMRINPFETMWAGLGRHFRDPRLRQLFGRYATYCGSSPFLAPATLMLVAHVEQEGVWSVTGGMHELARAMAELALKHGAEIRYGAEVTAIETRNGRVSAVRSGDDGFSCSDVIVNADCNAVASGLLGPDVSRCVTTVAPAARSLSAITWASAARTSGFELGFHNVFFSRDYRAEFEDLKTSAPSDPTVYICAQDRGSGTPPDVDRLLVLVNAPANGDQAAQPHAAVEAAMRRKLASCGLDVGWDSSQTLVTGPQDFERLFPATGGALYGRASHGWMASFQRPGAETSLPGLYLAGGSVHPGPGVPMAALSGRLAAECLMASRASTRRSQPVATAGGISTR
jgi:1-hydroxycarotenoid 3,4-desaturase